MTLPVLIFASGLLPTAVGLLVFAYLPGRWLLAPFANAFGGWARTAAATVLGWAFYTFFTDFSLKWFGPTSVGFYLAPGLAVWAFAAAVRFFGERESDASDDPDAQPLLVTNGQFLLACLLGFIAVAQVLPIEKDGGVYWGTPEVDWRSRLPVTNAIARDGLPAANPFFNPDGDSKLFFYYGFFLLPAACIWPTFSTGMGLETVGVLAVCVFVLGTLVGTFTIALGNAAVGDRKGGWTSGLLCFVTGLDLLPVLSLTLRGTPPGSVEWWNPAQITAVTAFPVWVPHHTLATLEVIFAHLLVWRMESRFSLREKAPFRGAKGDIAVLAVLLASAAMTSTYVAMLGFVSIFIHGLLKSLRLQSWRAGFLPMAAAFVGGLLAIPFYYQLSKFDEHVGPTLQPVMRPCPSEDLIRDWIVANVGLSPPIAMFVTRVGGLLPQYFFELGVLFFVLVYWRRTGIGRFDPDGLWNRLGVMTGVAFVVGSVLVSVRTWNCDLNWRIMHPVQIALLGAAAAFFRDFHSKPRPLIDKIGVALFILVGFAGTVYDLNRSRMDYLQDPKVGIRAKAALDSSVFLNQHLPANSRIAADPRNFRKEDAGRFGNEYFGPLLRRQMVIADDRFNAFPYGPNREHVEAVVKDFAAAFSAETTRDRRLEIFERYNVSCVLIDPGSPLWGRNTAGTFGRGANIIDGGEADGRKAIQLGSRSAND
jgi:hypothetical protein